MTTKNVWLGLKNELPPLNTIGNSTNMIEVTAVQGHTAQAKIISNWLERFQGKPIDSAAILLSSAPKVSLSFNMSSSYPLYAQFQIANLPKYVGPLMDTASVSWVAQGWLRASRSILFG